MDTVLEFFPLAVQRPVGGRALDDGVHAGGSLATNGRDTVFAPLNTIRCRLDGRSLDRGRRAQLGHGPRHRPTSEPLLRNLHDAAQDATG